MARATALNFKPIPGDAAGGWLRRVRSDLRSRVHSGSGLLGACAQEFYDLQVAHKSPVAAEALERIGVLYATEIQGRSPEERPGLRDIRSRPLLGSLKRWLQETLDKLSRKPDTAVAVRSLDDGT